LPELLVLQSVWGLDKCPGFDIENRLDEALGQVVAAGFDGVGVNLARTVRTEGVARVMNPLGLAWEAQVLVHDADQLKHWIGEAHRLGAHHLNVQIAGPTADFRAALALIDRLVAAAKDAPLPVWFETHRGRLTNDLLFTLKLLEERPGLPLTADLSHYPVAGEMELPLRDDQLAAIETILQGSHNFHGRVSTTHQVQVALDAPQACTLARPAYRLVAPRLRTLARTGARWRRADLHVRTRPAALRDHRARRQRTDEPLGRGPADARYRARTVERGERLASVNVRDI
jgi:hypothetical protein